MLISVIIGIALAGVTFYYQAQRELAARVDQLARAEADTSKTAGNIANAYLARFNLQLASNPPAAIPGVANPYEPSWTELQTVGVNTLGKVVSGLGGGDYRILLQRNPAGCTTACNVTGVVATQSPVMNPATGRIDPNLASRVAYYAGSDGGAVLADGTLQGRSGAWTTTLADSQPGQVVHRVGFNSSAWASFCAKGSDCNYRTVTATTGNIGAINGTTLNYAAGNFGGNAATADNATHAQQAEHARQAQLAEQATNALHAQNAVLAQSANHAVQAKFAKTAGRASAADYATAAQSANFASSAQNAGYATAAGSAATSGRADSADKAEIAEFANRSGAAESCPGCSIDGGGDTDSPTSGKSCRLWGYDNPGKPRTWDIPAGSSAMVHCQNSAGDEWNFSSYYCDGKTGRAIRTSGPC
ncbi:hypothetical protein CSQ89_07835 [Chitinimonas sp. BJB300]|nr:hypothetical protein CSQ89_07835 [Chitinimonas sp. BJB300]